MVPVSRFIYLALFIVMAWLYRNLNPSIVEIGLFNCFSTALIYTLIVIYKCFRDKPIQYIQFFCLTAIYLWLVRLVYIQDYPISAFSIGLICIQFALVVSVILCTVKETSYIMIAIVVYKAFLILAISFLIYNTVVQPWH